MDAPARASSPGGSSTTFLSEETERPHGVHVAFPAACADRSPTTPVSRESFAIYAELLRTLAESFIRERVEP